MEVITVLMNYLDKDDKSKNFQQPVFFLTLFRSIGLCVFGDSLKIVILALQFTTRKTSCLFVLKIKKTLVDWLIASLNKDYRRYAFLLAIVIGSAITYRQIVLNQSNKQQLACSGCTY